GGRGWYEDPTHRLLARYWDGTAWTERVDRAGHYAEDPIPQTAQLPPALVGSSTSRQRSIAVIGALGAAIGACIGLLPGIAFVGLAERFGPRSTPTRAALVGSIAIGGALGALVAVVAALIARAMSHLSAGSRYDGRI